MNNITKTVRLKKNDEYETPENAWVECFEFMKARALFPCTIWEPFVSKGRKSVGILHKYAPLYGFDVAVTEGNFFDAKVPETTSRLILVSNPPYTLKYEVFVRCVTEHIAAILLMPSSLIAQKRFIDAFHKHELEGSFGTFIPYRRIQYLEKHSCPFDTFWYLVGVGVTGHNYAPPKALERAMRREEEEEDSTS